MGCLSMEGFVGNGSLKGVLPKLLEEGWDDVQTLKLMKTEDMDAINMTQQQKDALEMRSYLHDRTLSQYGDKLEASGKSLPELLGFIADDFSTKFGMKRGHIARFMEKRSSSSTACAPEALQQEQPPHPLTPSPKTTHSSGNKGIHKATMDPELYRAAMGGGLMRYNINDQHELQFTSNKNTVLHVAAQFGNQKYVEKILEKSQSLLRCLNINGETPLHIAASHGYFEILRKLIDCAKELGQEELESGGGGAAKEMLRATNKDNDTALHMAVRNNHLRVVELLTQEDKEFTHPPNKAEETPLYLAAERGYDEVVSVILKNCTSPAYGGPTGKTALHAAAINFFDTGNTKKILEWKPDLIEEKDEHGWTPLHYAAHYENLREVRCLLEKDKSVAYITADEDDERTALHISAANGSVWVMKVLLSKCPDCWEMVNRKGQNILHIAVDMEQVLTIEYILKQSWITHLINQKDIEGNTPLHLLEACKYESPKLKWYPSIEKLLKHPSADRKATNNKNMTPDEVRCSLSDLQSKYNYKRTTVIMKKDLRLKYNYKRTTVSMDRDYITKWKRYREEREKELALTMKEIEENKKRRVEENKKRAETHLIVATLIATVTFAASFTMPGGYDGNEGPKQGMPVLLRAAAFQAFVITNTIAVICSISSGFLYASASFYSDEDKLDHRHVTAFWFILIAMGAMIVAFISGSYVVLSHSLGIAITVSVIGCLSFIILIPEAKKLYDNYDIQIV